MPTFLLRLLAESRPVAAGPGAREAATIQRIGVSVGSAGTFGLHLMSTLDRLSPEQRARIRIDEMLEAAGWKLQNYSGQPNIKAGPGVAVREFVTPRGPVDYMLFADGKVAGSVEAKAEGHTLRSVDNQTDRYNDGFKDALATKPWPRYADELLFQYVSTGTETLLTSRRDPVPRGREVFHFHKAETLAEWAQQEYVFRARLRQLPPVDPQGLRDIQFGALGGLEESLAADRARALAAITMGGGKTRLAVAETYRLLRFGGATRLLFLVDRVSLGEQAAKEFRSYVYPDGRRFDDDYVVQVLKSSQVNKSANLIICTIQRLYAMLRGETRGYDPELDEASSFDVGDGPPVEVKYNPNVPIEFFDLIFTDECHRSIYGRWGQVLDYFDAFTVGLTATPTPTTLAYFNDNVIAEYTQEQSVFDGVNVDQQLFRIRTEVGEHGATIGAGEWVKVRDKLTRATRQQQLGDDYPYPPEKLDRAVVNYSQIRTVVKAFKELVTTQLFPDRDEVPKTIFFCKHDQHAEDVLKVIREVFDRGNDFAKKITYKAEGTVDENIQEFRSDPRMRIAVTVEQVGTGIDVKPVECLVFMRVVGSRVLFNQMRGRAVRTIDPDDFQQVTPGAAEKGQTKEYSVLVDAVGITDEDAVLIDVQPVSEKKPSTPLKAVLRDIGMGLTDDETLKSAALRLRRLEKKLATSERQEFAQVADGRTMTEIVEALRHAADEDAQLEAAREQSGAEAPSNADLAAARERLVEQAIEQLQRSEVRRKLEALQSEVSEQYIHIGGHDQLVSAEFVDSPGEAKDIIATWRNYIEQHRDEHAALKAFYAEPYRRRPSFDEIEELAKAISRPPHHLTPERVWAAYEKLEADRVKGHGGKLTTDLVRLIRYTLQQDDELVPHEQVVHLRFDLWVQEHASAGRKFSAEQMRWLTLVRDRIVTSMSFDPTEDYDFPPFSDEGGINAAYELFGDGLDGVVTELNEALAT
jgi:type I restriction enzyme, R subunit